MKSKNKIKFFSLEMIGMFLVLMSIVGIVCLFAGEYLFGELGKNISGFFLGIFGYSSYLILILTSFYGILAVAGVKFRLGVSKKNLFLSLVFIYATMCLICLAVTPYSGSYGVYLKHCYKLGFSSKASVGGVFFALTYALVATLIKPLGAYLVYSLLVLLVVAIVVKRFFDKKSESVVSDKKFGKKKKGGSDLDLPFAPEQPAFSDGINLPFATTNPAQSREFTQPQYTAQPKPATFDDVIEKLTKMGSGENKTDFEVNEGTQRTRKYMSYQDMVHQDTSTTSPYTSFNNGSNISRGVSEPINKNSSSEIIGETYSDIYLDESVANPKMFTPKTEKKEERKQEFSQQNTYSSFTTEEKKDDFESLFAKPTNVPSEFDSLLGKDKTDTFAQQVYETLNDKKEIFETQEPQVEEKPASDTTFGASGYLSRMNGAGFGSVKPQPEQPKFVEKPVEVKPSYTAEDIKNYVFNPPPLSLFKAYDNNEDKYKLQNFIDTSSQTIKTVIKSMTGHDMEVTETHHGPTFTRFDLPVPIGVAIKSLVALEEDMRVQLNSDAVRIAAVPRSNKVGVEVSNEDRVTVGLKEILISDEFQLAKADNAPFVIGKDVTGNSIVLNMADLTHILIAGSSGSGKSVFITSLLVSMMYKCSPKSLRIVICDPKGVDFIAFKGAPHLLVDEIIVDRPKISKTLDWAIKEMNDRYFKLQQNGVPNIAYYNKKLKGKDEMARIILFIDEFADLVSGDKNILQKVQILAQKARAAGIHLILAMQRPSKDIVSGDIKVNFSTRIALKVQSNIDSRVILDEGGAECLLTHGDMMFFTPLNPQIIRAQGPFVSPDELMDVIEYLGEKNKPIFDEKVHEKINGTSEEGQSFGAGADEDDRDLEVKKDALRYIIESKQTSISAIQRELRLGFNRAAVIHNWLVKQGYIGPSLENNKQEVKITQEEFDRLYGNR